MVMFAWYFWPVIWSMIGIGAVVTAALCLVIAIMPAPHVDFRVHRPGALGSRRHGFRLARHAHA
jgi:hypothetical protein